MPVLVAKSNAMNQKLYIYTGTQQTILQKYRKTRYIIFGQALCVLCISGIL